MSSENNLKQLPKGWVRTKVGDIFEFVYGKGLVKSIRKETGPYPVYGSSGVVGFHDEYVANGPKVIVGRKGAAGAVHYCNENCWPIDTTYFISSIVDTKFSYYLLGSLRLNQFETSTAIPGLNRDDAYRLDILLPPFNEQKRIVSKIEELFFELDNGIAALKTAREQLKVYRQAVLKHAFEGKLTAKWREENPDKLETPEQLLAHIQQERNTRYQQQLEDWKVAVKRWEINGSNGKRPGKPKQQDDYSSEPFGEEPIRLPDTWLWVRLGELVTGIDQGWSPKCENVPADVDNWGVIKTTAVQHSEFQEHENKMLPGNLEPRQQHELKAGDILITRAGPRIRVGVCCLVKKVRAKLMNCDKVYRIRSLENICLPEYIEAVLNSPAILDNLEGVKSGINDSGVNLNQNAFLKMLIPYCDLSEQKELISKLDESLSIINKQNDIFEVALKHADTLRQSILKKAFSGQLVPQDPNDEPASELLTRIRATKSLTKDKMDLGYDS